MSRPTVSAKNFRTYADLASAYVEGQDFRIRLAPRFQSGVGIVAPHGGSIESHTSEIATAIAGEDFSLYRLEGCLPSRNFESLHLTSHCFDEPSCLDLLANCDDVVTVHGCNVAGEVVLVGGLDATVHAATRSGSAERASAPVRQSVAASKSRAVQHSTGNRYSMPFKRTMKL